MFEGAGVGLGDGVVGGHEGVQAGEEAAACVARERLRLRAERPALPHLRLQGVLERVTHLVGQHGVEAQEGRAREAQADETLVLADGVTTLAQGASDLKDGADELAEGTGELRTQTADIDDKIADGVNESLSDYLNPEFEARDFVSGETGHVSRVQFVIKTAAIEEPDDADDADDAEFHELRDKLFHKLPFL